MGRKGSRYTLEEKLFCIGLVRDSGWAPKAVQRKYGVKDDQVRQWIERFTSDGVDGLKARRTQQMYSQKLKLEVVQNYLAGNTSYATLAREYGISNGGVIYQWVSLYTSGKSLLTTGRARPMKDGRKTTQMERIEIAQWIIANDYNYTKAAARFKVSYGQVYSWVKKFKQGGEEALADRRGKAKEDNGQLTEVERLKLKNKRLQARLTYVSTEAAVLKKLQELERRNAGQTNNIRPFNNSHKK
ncbi:helix-turn-helix domain-containing protein [Lacticaseibacillus sp. 53-4]|uniref:helix-turn-helix domain-containing protein n=1 Tax=Lacticaseibacillus sp. 53-4 TaxID=2799575 RepID=UPI001943EE23|nr:helix-turn-helix domain-containing protein [Lacticaseibacillus sp. 53-4]